MLLGQDNTLNAVMTDINRTLLQRVTVFISYEFYLCKVMLFQSATELDNFFQYFFNQYLYRGQFSRAKRH